MTEQPQGEYKRATRGRMIVLTFTILYIAAAAVYFYTTGVKEFTLYLAVLLGLVAFVAWTLPRTKLPTWALWCLSILGLLHALGGGVIVNGDVLYNLVLIPIIDNGVNGVTIWRFDQLVHPFGTAIGAIIIYFFIARASKLPRVWMVVLAALAAMGLGALNEVIEFITKLTIPNTEVGGYSNTAIDLCANLIGSLVGAAFAALRWGKRPPEA
ncbi:MAG: hypothetical protein AB199_01365 [Parcubacteria bacterium C7867-004]|nr:MAG: hypothetical protein AB199_01365 [Parcubacteria bacterium C7867-004]